MEFTLRATTIVPDVAPPEVFDVITDLERLPDWNLEIPSVVELPAVLEVGSEWLVEIAAMHTHWQSRSRVIDIDRAGGRFAYRSQTVDGNPSYAEWRWHLTPAADGRGTDVAVEVDVRPKTFWRRYLLSTLRRRGLDAAVHESLTALREQAITRKEAA